MAGEQNNESGPIRRLGRKIHRIWLREKGRNASKEKAGMSDAACGMGVPLAHEPYFFFFRNGTPFVIQSGAAASLR